MPIKSTRHSKFPVPSPPPAGKPVPARRRRTDVLAFFAATVLCMGLLVGVLHLQEADLNVPFQYHTSGDTFSQAMLTKALLDNPWYLHNRLLGAPWEQDFHDYPLTDTIHFLIEKALSLVTVQYGYIINLHFLLGFVFTTWTSLLVFRILDLAYPPAILGSIVYAFLPYHFWRGQHHLLLGFYYFIPLMVLVLLWCMEQEPLWRSGPGRWWTRYRPTRRGAAAGGICVVMGSAGTYYAFFAVLLLGAAGVAGILLEKSWRERWRRVLTAGLLAGVIAGLFAVNLLPTILYSLQHGPNASTIVRNPLEAEIYGLRINQMFLPIAGHRIPFLARIKGEYLTAGLPLHLVNENTGASLGLFTALGFSLLLVLPLAGIPALRRRTVFQHLSALNLCAVLIATSGGFGAILAAVVSAKIRNYNRLVVYIAFLAVCAMVVLLDALWRRWAARSPGRAAVMILALAAVGFGAVLDQTSPSDVPPYALVSQLFRNDDEFVLRIEKMVPRQAMILQLPYLEFPEPGALPGKLSHYDEMRGYLHSSELRWSYGAMKGRYGDGWLKDLLAHPVPEMLEAAAVAGFSGIYVDRFGYADAGGTLERDLRTRLREGPVTSANARLAFYDLQPFAGAMRARAGSGRWQAMRDALLHPLLLDWRGGFSGLEHAPGYDFRWCGRDGELTIENPTGHPARFRMQMGLVGVTPYDAKLQVSGPGISESLTINNQRQTPFARQISVPPGRSAVRFVCTGDILRVPGDPRELVFQVQNFSTALSEQPALALEWRDGFSSPQRAEGKTWRWCGREGELVLHNTGRQPVAVTLDMALAAGQEGGAAVLIEAPGFADKVVLNGDLQPFSRCVEVPPGDFKVRFRCRTQPSATGDNGRLFRVENFRYQNPLLVPHVIQGN